MARPDNVIPAIAGTTRDDYPIFNSAPVTRR